MKRIEGLNLDFLHRRGAESAEQAGFSWYRVQTIHLKFFSALLCVLCASAVNDPPVFQIVCVGRSEPKCAPKTSSIFIFSTRDFSSGGKRMPTPWVRLPAARAGVIQATLPAMG